MSALSTVTRVLGTSIKQHSQYVVVGISMVLVNTALHNLCIASEVDLKQKDDYRNLNEYLIDGFGSLSACQKFSDWAGYL